MRNVPGSLGAKAQAAVRPLARRVRARNQRPASEDSILLRDGRRLGFRQFGADDGVPVFAFGGIPSSRLVPPSFGAAAGAHGARLIVTERPGLGLSDFQPGRTLLDWPADVADLADQLGGASSFSVLGMSGGGSYAHACAYAMPDRVVRAVVVAGLTPLDRYGLVDDVAAGAGRPARAALRLPGATHVVFALLAAAMRHSPEHASVKIAEALSEPDKRFLASEDGRRLLDNLVEGVRQGGRGWEHDAAITGMPWGFDPSSIQGEVCLWHGDEDNAVPLEHVQQLADALPNANLTVCPGTGHMGLVFDRADEIVETLVRPR